MHSGLTWAWLMSLAYFPNRSATYGTQSEVVSVVAMVGWSPSRYKVILRSCVRLPSGKRSCNRMALLPSSGGCSLDDPVAWAMANPGLKTG